MSIIDELLNKNKTLRAIKMENTKQRLEIIQTEIYKMIYSAVGSSLISKDKLLLVMRLV